MCVPKVELRSYNCWLGFTQQVWTWHVMAWHTAAPRATHVCLASAMLKAVLMPPAYPVGIIPDSLGLH